MQSNALQLLFEGQKLWLAAGREGSSFNSRYRPPLRTPCTPHLEKAGNGGNTLMGSGYFDQKRGDSGLINDFLADYI